MYPSIQYRLPFERSIYPARPNCQSVTTTYNDVHTRPSSLSGDSTFLGIDDLLHPILKYIEPLDGYRPAHQPKVRAVPHLAQAKSQSLEQFLLPGHGESRSSSRRLVEA